MSGPGNDPYTDEDYESGALDAEGYALAYPEPDGTPQPPSNGDLCEDCGHQTYSHQLAVCLHPYPCFCDGMLWQGRRWHIPLTGQPEPAKAQP